MSALAADAGTEPSTAEPLSEAVAERPSFLPEKFWDEASGTVRVEALARSYRELERKLGSGHRSDQPVDGTQAIADPASADAAIDPGLMGYRIKAPHPLVSQCQELDTRLIAAGLNEAQAQLVYDLAAERLLPMLDEAKAELEAMRQLDRLERHFGSAEAWRETARQLKGWATAHLDPGIVAALATSADGIIALHQMMHASEPQLLDGGAEPAAELSEERLGEMMRDRRYWHKRDPDFIARVTDGFRKLYAAG